jgi:hypothetical protein
LIDSFHMLLALGLGEVLKLESIRTCTAAYSV